MDIYMMAGLYRSYRAPQATALDVKYMARSVRGQFDDNDDQIPDDIAASLNISGMVADSDGDGDGDAVSGRKILANSSVIRNSDTLTDGYEDDEHYTQGSLCGTCRKIDWRSGFFPESIRRDNQWYGNVRTITVAHLKRNAPKCPICGIMVDAILTNGAFKEGYEQAKHDAICLWRFFGFAQTQTGDQISDICRIEIESVGRARDSVVFVYVKSADPSWKVASIGTGRVVPATSIDIGQINKWLSACNDFHRETCNGLIAEDPARDSTVFNFRVIDVERGCITQVPHDTTYLTLSYCWGSGNHLKLTTETSAWMTKAGAFHHDPDKIPKTISDAMFLTRQIKEKYLWVDALCILQDDNKDKEEQIQKMDLIYQRAKATIVATGKDAWAGIDGIRPGTRSAAQHQKQCGVFTLITGRPSLEERMLGSAWETRAWTFQEKILSRRLLIFAQGQIFFRCNSDSWSEDIALEPLTGDLTTRRVGGLASFSKPDLSPGNSSSGQSFDRYPVHALSSMYEPWLPGRKRIALNDPRYQYCDLVVELTKRSLTVKTDILDAFQGVLNYTAPSFHGEFYHGIAEDFLEGALLWHSEGAVTTTTIDDHFPSWSWASSFRPVKMDYLRRHTRCNGIKAVTTFFRIDKKTQKTCILKSDFEIATDPDVQDRINFLVQTPSTNQMVRELLQAEKIDFDRAICCITEVVELRVSKRTEPEPPKDQGDLSIDYAENAFFQLRGNYYVWHDNGKPLGSLYLDDDWRQTQPERLKFVLIACEVEGGHQGILEILTMHVILVDCTRGLYRRLALPQGFFVVYNDWATLQRKFEVVVLVCHQPEQNLSESLKRCGRCKSIQYCSTECQKLDWPKHKRQCREGGLDVSTGPRTRQTMRFNLGDWRRQANGEPPPEPEADTIYYLQTSTPHLHDISVSGPYYPLESIVPQVLNNFGDECAHGCKTFEEIIGDHGPGLASFQHLTSPINNDPNRTRTIRLIREQNPTMAAKLPGEAWYVVETEMNFDSRVVNAARCGNRPAPVKSMLVHKTFDNVEAANEEAKTLAAELAAFGPNGRVMETPGTFDDQVYCTSVVTGAGSSRKVVSFLVRHDSGQITHPA